MQRPIGQRSFESFIDEPNLSLAADIEGDKVGGGMPAHLKNSFHISWRDSNLAKNARASLT